MKRTIRKRLYRFSPWLAKYSGKCLHKSGPRGYVKTSPIPIYAIGPNMKIYLQVHKLYLRHWLQELSYVIILSKCCIYIVNHFAVPMEGAALRYSSLRVARRTPYSALWWVLLTDYNKSMHKAQAMVNCQTQCSMCNLRADKELVSQNCNHT